MANQYQNFSNPTIVPDQKYGWDLANQNTGQAINSIGSYLAKQQDNVQQLQLQQASDLSKAHIMASQWMPAAVPTIENMMSQNPYARRAFPGQQPGQGQSLGQSGAIPTNGVNPNIMGSMLGAVGTTGYGTGMYQTPSTSNDTSSSNGGSTNMSPVVTSATIGGMKPPEYQVINPVGEQVKAQATAQGEANVAPSKEYATKMADTQALSQENIARDNTQMTSVFATLKNLHDIHSQLASQNLAGTHLGELEQEGMPYVGDVAALTDQKPADLQNNIMSPDNQNLIGQFQAGRNEGITRSIQPIQNQVDKTGASRISESLMDMTKGEYGDLTDSQATFDGKTLGTAKTLYRITLASQNYADQLKAQGIKLNSNDPNFNPDTIAQHIYNQAQEIQFTPAQAKDFNGYANQIMGSKNVDYSGVLPKQGSMNPVNGQQQPTKQGNQMPKFNPATQKVQQNSRTGEYRVVNL